MLMPTQPKRRWRTALPCILMVATFLTVALLNVAVPYDLGSESTARAGDLGESIDHAISVIQKQASPLLCYGFKPSRSRPFVPVDGHYGRRLFDGAKMTAFIGMPSIVSVHSATSTDKIEGSHRQEFHEDMQVKLSGEMGVDLMPLASLQAALSGDFGVGTAESHEYSYYQQRRSQVIGSATLSPAWSWMNITRSLRDVLTTDAKVMLGITPIPGYMFDADYVVATFGPFYIKQASFGASMIVSGYTGADNSDENALNDLKWEVGSHFFKKASAEAESHRSSSSHVRTTEGSAGGDPGLAMQGRWGEWSESAEGHPTVTSYQLGKISDLLNPYLEGDRHAQLEAAVDRAIETIEKEAYDLEVALLGGGGHVTRCAARSLTAATAPTLPRMSSS